MFNETRQHCLILTRIGNLKPISHHTQIRVLFYCLNFLKLLKLTGRYYFSWNVFVSSGERFERIFFSVWWTENEHRYPQVSLSFEGNASNSIARGNEAANTRPTFSLHSTDKLQSLFLYKLSPTRRPIPVPLAPDLVTSILSLHFYRMRKFKQDHVGQLGWHWTSIKEKGKHFRIPSIEYILFLFTSSV